MVEVKVETWGSTCWGMLVHAFSEYGVWSDGHWVRTGLGDMSQVEGTGQDGRRGAGSTRPTWGFQFKMVFLYYFVTKLMSKHLHQR